MANNAPWTRSTWSDAGQIMMIVDPEVPTSESVGQPLHGWYAQLAQSGDLGTAVEFMAHAMSRYDCVAWATRSAISTGLIDRGDPLVVAVLQWIDNPEDPLRRAAGDAAETVKKDTPAKLLCLGVWFSGGSLAPEGLAPVQPPADACATLCAAALLVGAHTQADPDAALGQIGEFGEAMLTAQ